MNQNFFIPNLPHKKSTENLHHSQNRLSKILTNLNSKYIDTLWYISIIWMKRTNKWEHFGSVSLQNSTRHSSRALYSIQFMIALNITRIFSIFMRGKKRSYIKTEEITSRISWFWEKLLLSRIGLNNGYFYQWVARNSWRLFLDEGQFK